MKKILIFITSFVYLVCFGQSINTDKPYDIIPPSPESFYKSTFGNTEINDFRGEPNVSIPLFSLQNGNIPLDLELKYTKAGVKVNDIPNSTGINWVLNTGGIITRTINDIADEKAVHTLINQLPYISISNPQTWGAYVLQNNDHEVDIFNFTIGNYSGSFYLDGNFQPVILTKDNNCKVEVIGSFSQNYEFKITTNNGIVYHFGGIGFTEKTSNKENQLTAGVTSFYLKNITSSSTNKTINFEYETRAAKSIITDIQENYNTAIINIVAPSCGGHPLPSNSTQRTTTILKITDPKRISRIVSDDKIISFEYSNDYILYNKLNNINVNFNNNLLKKYTFNYLDSFNNNNNNQLERYFLGDVKFYENHLNTLTLKEIYTLEYDHPLEIPARLSKSIDYLGYYNGQSNTGSLIPNINLFNNTNNPIYNNLGDRRPVFDLAKYGTLKSINYPTKGKTVFEYEPISEGPKDDEFYLAVGNQMLNNPTNYVATDIKEFFPYEFFNGNAKISLQLVSHDVSTSPTIKAWSELQILDDLNNIVYSKKLAVSKITPEYSTSIEDEFLINRTKKYKFLLKIRDNVCSNCAGSARIKYKKLDIQNGPGVRLKKQYDITENDTVNIKRIYYTDFVNIPNLKKNNVILTPNFKTLFLLQTRIPNPHTQTMACGFTPFDNYPGSSTLVENIKSNPYLSSLGYYEDDNYFNLSDPMYSNVTLSFGGDHFEKGGEEKKYFIKPRSGEFGLFSPNYFDISATDKTFVNEGVLSMLTQYTMEKFFRLFSFPNVDGKLLTNKLFKVQNNNIVYSKIIENTYNFNEDRKVYNILGADVYPSANGDPYDLKNKYITSYPTSINEALLSETTITDFPNSNNPNNKIISNIKNYYLNPQNQLTKQITTLSDHSIQETTYAYAFEKGNQKLLNANMISIPLEITTLKRKDSTDLIGKMTSKLETIYPDQNNYPTSQTGNLLLPLSVQSYGFQSNLPSLEITYDQYDSKGNLSQYTDKGDFTTIIIWGYNQTQPIIKIEGAGLRVKYGTPSDLKTLLDQAINESNLDAAAGANNDETPLLSALNNVRNSTWLSDAQVTTYTHDSLIGVTSITPPSGIREIYKYDSANRLENIKDINGKLLKEFKYNYKH